MLDSEVDSFTPTVDGDVVNAGEFIEGTAWLEMIMANGLDDTDPATSPGARIIRELSSAGISSSTVMYNADIRAGSMSSNLAMCRLTMAIDRGGASSRALK